jgi:hypothetical protein
MKLAVLHHNNSSFYPWAKSSLQVLQATLAISVVGEIAVPGFLSPAIAQPVQQSRQAPAGQQSGAAQLGGVVRVNCFQVQYMPVKSKDCELVPSPGPNLIFDIDTLRKAEKDVNSYTRLQSPWQKGQPVPRFGFVIPVPPLF